MPAYSLEIATVLLGMALLLAEAFTAADRKRQIGWGALIGISAIFVASFFVTAHETSDGNLWSFYTDDRLALFYKSLALLTTGIVLFLGLEYHPVLAKFSARAGGGPATGEFFCLPVFICAGMMWMASAIDLTTIFVSLELVTIAFYIMVAYMRRNVGSLEAGVKYLILGALSTGFLVYGFAWLYGSTGQTSLAGIAQALQNPAVERQGALFAFALILVALSFKVAAVPFHFWVPDVYQGAPTPVTAYLSVGSKAAGFIVATRLIEPFLTAPAFVGVVSSILLAIAAGTLLLGNMAAIPQQNFKRLLAYSSISHAGFLVLALGAAHGATGSMSASTIIAFYLASYLFSTLLAFAVLVVMNRHDGSDDLAGFNGLYRRAPFLAFALTVSVASLAGLPLTFGFLGKLFVFIAAAKAGVWPVVAIAVLGAAAGFYFYFKVLRNIYWLEPANGGAIPVSRAMSLLMLALIVGTILFGFYPKPILALLP
jgi:NADH-quinone oxidoreductase subunit N